MKVIAPKKVRELKAQMVLKALSLEEVARRAKVNYSVASAILKGRRVDPDNLARLRNVIAGSPMPEEATAA